MLLFPILLCLLPTGREHCLKFFVAAIRTHSPVCMVASSLLLEALCKCVFHGFVGKMGYVEENRYLFLKVFKKLNMLSVQSSKL